MIRFSLKPLNYFCLAAMLMSSTATADNSNLSGTSTSGTTNATFELQTNSSLTNSQGPFATSDSLALTGVVKADSSDVGKSAYLYVVANVDGALYYKDALGVWHPWSGLGNEALKPTSSVTLAATNSVEIISAFNYPGLINFYIGYQLTNEDKITYNSQPAKITISDFVFNGIDYPLTVEDKRKTASSNSFTFKGETKSIAYTKLISTNEQLPLLGGGASETATFGLLTDKNGDAFMEEDGSPSICSNGSGPDHTSLLTNGNSLFAVTQLECSNGGAYITKLNQSQDGALSAVSTRPVDFSNVFGTYVNCAGITTPWNTHLGSEEYEPPMSELNVSAENQSWFNSPTWHDKHIASIAAYNKIDNTAENAAYMGYYYGWIPEIKITSENGDHQVAKHYAMGRAAFEQGYVMPDNRTVYLSDDGTNVGFYMFIADTEKDLSAGTLYAARWDQTSGEGVGQANLSWVNLGHANNSEIKTALDNKTTFNDLFEQVDPLDAATGSCPDGYSSSRANDILVCVKLKEGMDKLASRMEMRLYASIKGATTEFRKEEGITFNPDSNVLYVAMSEVRKGMEDGSSNDIGGPNHVRINTANKCGAVYGLDIKAGKMDSSGFSINSNYVVGNMYGVLAGTSKDYTGTELEGNKCDIDGLSNPDNVSYLAKYGILIIGEDTGSHQNDLVWSYNVVTKQLTRIAYTPYGSETTSPFWHKNINGYGYLTLVTQHPYGESDTDQAQTASDKESYVGYIGPFPALD
jgi:uncharacterized protein